VATIPKTQPAELLQSGTFPAVPSSAELGFRGERLVGFMLKTLRRRGAIVGGVSVALRRSLVQSVSARLSLDSERWRREDRAEGLRREDPT